MKTGNKRAHKDVARMKVLGASKFGREHLSFASDVPKPTPRTSTEVVVRVEYSDLNPVDRHKLNSRPEGSPTPAHRTPFVVGFGGSGVVESASPTADEGTRRLLRKRVAFLADPSKDGSYAQYVRADRRVVAAVPEGDNGGAGHAIPLHEAASVPVAGCTAFESLEKVGLPISSSGPDPPPSDAGAGRRLLAIGGAGGVGSWIARLARSNYPALELVGTTGSAESATWCRKMGYDRTVGHGEVEELGGGPEGSCDAVICLAEPTRKLFASVAEVLRPFGKICLVVAGDGIRELDLSFVFFKCGVVSTETVFGSIRDGHRLDQAGEMTTILELMKKGRVKAPLSDEWNDSLSDWYEANKEGGYIDKVGAGHMKGKLVMKIGD